MRFRNIDERYKSKRKDLSEKYGPREIWSIIDHWPLYCGIANLSRFMAVADIVRESLPIPGHIAEFGSWRGANLLFMTKLLRIYDPHGTKQVHCFDSFEGLTEFSPQDGEREQWEGVYKGSLEELQDFIELYELSEIVIHQGLIENTLRSTLDANPALSFSLIYCDTDLYSSTKVILESMHERLMQGGTFVFDEWNHDQFPGEGVAANEFLKAHAGEYEIRHILNTRQPSLLARKI